MYHLFSSLTIFRINAIRLYYFTSGLASIHRFVGHKVQHVPSISHLFIVNVPHCSTLPLQLINTRIVGDCSYRVQNKGEKRMDNITASEIAGLGVGTLLLCATIAAPKVDAFISASQRRS